MRRPLALLLAALALSGASCDELECGAGTIEVDGECIAGTLLGDGGIDCGPGTVFDPESGQCRNECFASGTCGECGPNTVIVVNDAGVPVCVGTGGGNVDCELAAPPCPTPSAGDKTIVCGRVFDLEDTAPIDEAGLPSLDDVEVRLYEPLSFIGNPNTAEPVDVVQVDACGYFVSGEVDTPFTKLIAVGVDDRRVDGVPIADEFILTGIAAIADPGLAIPNRRAFFAHRSLIADWGAQAGADFEADGVYVPIYVDTTVDEAQRVYPFPGRPVSGVVIATAAGVPVTMNGDQDWYFADDALLARTTPDPALTATGTNGSGMATGLSLAGYSGTGMEPAGCTWDANQAATVPTVVFVQEKPSVCGP